MKKAIVFAITLLFLLISISPIIFGLKIQKIYQLIYSGNTLYVGGSGPGNYTKIQSAIDDAFNGDTVFVYNGTYYEDVEVYKSINLVGEDRNITEIFNFWDPYVITITADFVNINGFTINNDWSNRYYFGGIIVESCNNNISKNIIKGDWDEETGIEITDNSNNNTILNNIICNNLIGLEIYTSSNNTIMGNIFSSNWYFGMETYQSSNNIIKDNIFIKNEHDLSIHKSYNNTIIMNNFLETQCCTCLDIRYSYNNKIILNNITQNGWGMCIVLVDNSINNIISNNTISNGNEGIRIWYSSSYNTIINNNISSNDCGIYIEEFSNNNSIYHNNFINNSKKAYDECNNSWDNGYPSGGNYWDDYTDEDNDGDGIGDTPYPVPGGDNVDRYPFMKPNGWNNTRPNKPVISGPTNGRTGLWYEYNFSISDPEGDLLWIHIDWEYGTPSKWDGPFLSGSIVKYNYSWRKKGTYTIRAQTMDSNGLLSEWGTLEVTIPRTRVSTGWYSLFLERFPILENFFSFFIEFRFNVN
jgi:parallel beta-helix repeat protein